MLAQYINVCSFVFIIARYCYGNIASRPFSFNICSHLKLIIT